MHNDPAFPNCTHTVYLSYDEKGNATQFIDTGMNNGGDIHANCSKFDPEINRPVIFLEGGASCPNDLQEHLPAGAERKTSIQWLPELRIKSKISEPGQITTLVYNGQPDPTAGNSIASCAPASAILPGGKPIAAVCKKVLTSTTDKNGAKGFNATPEAGLAPRIWRYTYNQYGQVLTEDGPRTDLADITSYTYHSATAFTGSDPYAVGVTMGDLKSVTNALGQVTQYTQYNKHGQLLESIDLNGVVSSFKYDLRQRLLSSTVGGKTTNYSYDPIGQLTRVTLPDNSYIGYNYDPAHRLTGFFDGAGNSVNYTLDNAGNRTAEIVKDPAGVLRRQMARSYDALSRTYQVTGTD
ncbi:hypothetical protein Acidovoranil_32610 [Acidovorax sp. FG27]